MSKIIKIVFGFLIIIIIIVFGLTLFKKKSEKSVGIVQSAYEQDEVPTDENSDEYFEYRFGLKNLSDNEKDRILDWGRNGSHEVIWLMCQKNGDWSKLPISKETREEYSEKDGLLKDYQFETIELVPGEYPNSGNVEIITTNGVQKTKFYIHYSYGDNGINSVTIDDVIHLTDADGNELNSGFPFDDKHMKLNFLSWDNPGLTEKFKSKYGTNILSWFIHYSPLEYNYIGFDERYSDLENHMAFFSVTSVLECKEREYKVYFTLDENLYLDDIDVQLVKEVDIEPDNKNSGTKAFYLNSCLDKANISDSFKLYLENNGSYNDDIKDIDVDISVDEFCLDPKTYNEYIRCYRMKNGDINSYYVRYFESENGVIDKITSEKLIYVNMTAEEVKEAYLRGHPQE